MDDYIDPVGLYLISGALSDLGQELQKGIEKEKQEKQELKQVVVESQLDDPDDQKWSDMYLKRLYDREIQYYEMHISQEKKQIVKLQETVADLEKQDDSKLVVRYIGPPTPEALQNEDLVSESMSESIKKKLQIKKWELYLIETNQVKTEKALNDLKALSFNSKEYSQRFVLTNKNAISKLSDRGRIIDQMVKDNLGISTHSHHNEYIFFSHTDNIIALYLLYGRALPDAIKKIIDKYPR